MQPYEFSNQPLVKADKIPPGQLLMVIDPHGKVSYLSAVSIAVQMGAFGRFKGFYGNYNDGERIELKMLLQILNLP